MPRPSCAAAVAAFCAVSVVAGGAVEVTDRAFYRNRTALSSMGEAAKLTAIVLSHNHVKNVGAIARLLLEEPDVGQIVIAEDGSTDGSLAAWRAALRDGVDVVVETGDVHEIRAYNVAARRATQKVLCFLQDDDLPDDAGWAWEVVELLEHFRDARLAIVSGLATEVCQVELGEAPVDHPAAMKNSKETHPLPFEATLGGFKTVPFMFATEGWLSPLCVRADAWRDVGGFDETLAAPGEPGIGLDIHLSLRAAAAHGFTVGVHGAKFDRGVGGHGTVSDDAKTRLRLKKRAEISQRIRAVAGCRWPPEMLRHARALNARLLTPRKGDDVRSAIDAGDVGLRETERACRPFLSRPCPPRGPPGQGGGPGGRPPPNAGGAGGGPSHQRRPRPKTNEALTF